MNRLHVVTLLAFSSCFAQTPPALRLSDQVRPTHYALDLRLHPDEDTYSGTINIEVQVREATPLIWLNSTDLKISKASVKAAGKETEAQVIAGGKEFVGLQLKDPLSADTATIHIAFTGVLNKNDVEGIFKQTENGSSYILTQFEPTSARRAFPCFDEPGYKVPWQVTVHARKADIVASNTPIESEQDETSGMKKVRFAETKPLPSYLVAIAAGPFDVVDGGTAGRKRTPLRFLVPRGRGGDTAWVKEVTPKLFNALEEYFGVPYPFEKLDQVTIPVTVGFGAMENAGLITYVQRLLVARKVDDTIQWRRSSASVIAHEMGHQWFGNMVTPSWWDDIWLNEAFASWIEDKVITQLYPEWKRNVAVRFETYGAMGMDSLVSSRKIRQPIESPGDIGNAFDSITYRKGRAVIGMFEHFVGPDKFQRGVQAYMKKHAFGNASTSDFLTSISGAYGSDIGSAFSTFLDRGGIPLLRVDLQCGKGSPPAVTVQQERALPAGSTGARNVYWQIPVCIEYEAGGTVSKKCELVTDPKQRIELKGARACPAWINANAGASGYYQVLYGGDLNAKIGEHFHSLSPIEKVESLLNSSEAVTRGQMLPGDALRSVRRYQNSPEREVVSASLDLLSVVRRDVPKDLLPQYARFIQNTYGARARQIGWHVKPGESADDKLLRNRLVPYVARYGDDEELTREAVKIAQAWLKDERSVDPEIAGDALKVAAFHGNRALYSQLVDAAKKAKDRNRRTRILSALGSFRDPEIARSGLGLTLDPDLDIRDSMYLLTSYLYERDTEALGWEFLKPNYDKLLNRLPSLLGTHAGSDLPATGKSFCTEEGRRDVADFFRERIKKIEGGERALAATLETIQLCQARRSPAQQASLREFLSSAKVGLKPHGKLKLAPPV